MSKLVDDQDEFVASCREPVAEVGDQGSAQALVGLLLGEAVQAESSRSVSGGFPESLSRSRRPEAGAS